MEHISGNHKNLWLSGLAERDEFQVFRFKFQGATRPQSERTSVSPPQNALVLWVDEKSQIQALERSQPIFSLGIDHPERATSDYFRPGTLWWLDQNGLSNVVATMGADCSERQAELIVSLTKAGRRGVDHAGWRLCRGTARIVTSSADFASPRHAVAQTARRQTADGFNG